MWPSGTFYGYVRPAKPLKTTEFETPDNFDAVQYFMR